MRASLALLLALAVGACSDSNGPHQLPVLTTQLSNAGGAMVVTLNASNPTDTTVRMSYYSQTVYAQIKIGGQWRSGSMVGSFTTQTDSVVLTSGANAPVGAVSVYFSAPAFETGETEYFTIAPGTYSVRACVDPWTVTSPAGGVVQGVCGNGVRFTYTP